jgi:hypothetical protein
VVHAMLGHARRAMSGGAMSCQTLVPCHARWRHALPGGVTQYHARSCHAMPGGAMPGQAPCQAATIAPAGLVSENADLGRSRLGPEKGRWWRGAGPFG